MANIKPCRGVLIDFDGVIAKSAVDNIIKFVYNYISELTPISVEFIHSFIKNVACFPPELTIPMLLKSLGLRSSIHDFYEKFKEFDNCHEYFSVEPDFGQFIEFCNKNQILYKIFSLANPARLEVIGNMGEGSIYSLKGKSKADIRTFKKLRKDLRIDLQEWIYLDDNPIALRTGKLEGLNTAMMLNDVYTKRDYEQFADFIDFKVTSFSEFQRHLSKLTCPV